MKTLIPALAASAGLCLAHAAAAFVAIPVGGHPGELDVAAQLTAERGKTEPNENTASWFKTRDFYEYQLSVGYTFGDVGPLQFFSTRLDVAYFRSPEETSDPSQWILAPPGGGTAGVPGAGECTAGAVYLGNGTCRFYDADDGTLVRGSVSFAAIHDPHFGLGFFVRGTVPIRMNLEKFANPRIDYLAVGSQVAVELLPWLGYESTFFLGLGTRPFGNEQNGAIGLTNVFHFSASKWLLPWKAGMRIGPYVEMDINERYDARYDAAYSAVRLPQPGGQAEIARDRIRASRFALVFLPYFLVTENLAVEAGYVQKFFGYDARATQAYFFGVRALFDLR